MSVRRGPLKVAGVPYIVAYMQRRGTEKSQAKYYLTWDFGVEKTISYSNFPGLRERVAGLKGGLAPPRSL